MTTNMSKARPIPAAEYIELAQFRGVQGVLEGSEWLMVVKSRNQSDRRRRMLESKNSGRFGRLQARPTETGVVARVKLSNGKVRVLWQAEFPEPRHATRVGSGFLVTAVDRVLKVSSSGQVEDGYTHPLFACLHTVCISSDGGRVLVASSGYDAVIEIDLNTRAETYRWIAWDHGFNPDDDGVWLTLDPDTYDRHIADGERAELIDPLHYDEQGLLTAKRSAHPNAAVYDQYNQNSILTTMGHSGAIFRVDLSDGRTNLVADYLAPMAHGLRVHKSGWMITNTTRGEVCFTDAEFVPEVVAVLRGLPGKDQRLGDAEWVQQVVPASDSLFLAIDSNRSIICFDMNDKVWSGFSADPEWCVQDAVLLAN